MLTSLQLLDTEVQIRNFNNNFLLLNAESPSGIQSIGRAIFQKQFEFVEEVIVTETEICLKLNKHFSPSKIDALKNLSEVKIQSIRTYKLPIYFAEHEDWKNIEIHTKLPKNEVISELEQSEFSVAMFGFLPGFVYLNGLTPSLQVPRKTVPSKYVKANSLAIGGRYIGIYSVDSPGGWHVIGQLPISVLQIPEVPPVIINLGDKIQLHPIDEMEYNSLLKNPKSLKEYNA